MPAPTILDNQSRFNNASSSDVVADRPTTVVNGQWLAVQLLFPGSLDVSAAPTGWDAVPFAFETNGSAAWRSKVYLKKITDALSEPTSYTWTLTGAATVSTADILRLSDAASTPVDVHSSAQIVAGDANCTAPSLTTSGADELLLYFGSVGQNQSWTPDANMAEVYDLPTSVTGTRSITCNSEERLSAGATGTRTAVRSGGTGQSLAQMVAILPDTGGTPPTVEEIRPDAILEQTNDTKTLANLQRDVP